MTHDIHGTHRTGKAVQSAAIRFGVLGPVAAWYDGAQVDLGPPKRRVLLARLLLDGGRPVSVERLCRDLWSADNRPAGAVSTVHAHISRLRTVLEPERAAGTRSTLLVRESAGYSLRAPRETLDSTVFEDLLGTARRLMGTGQAEEALRSIEDALRLWRGPALHDAADHGFAASEVNRLQSLRQTADEMRVATLLELGRADSAVTLAETLTITAPLREGSWALLMKALYATGRSAEALQQYERFRVGLAEELGVDPGPNLRELHLAILNEDTASILPEPRGAVSVSTTPADRPEAERPGPVTAALPLTGRTAERDRLAATTARTRTSGAHWAVVTGARGMGKTRLLDEAAEQAARQGFRLARLACCGSSDNRESTAIFGPGARLVEQLAKDSGPFSRPPRWTEEASLTVLVRTLAEHPTVLLIDDMDTLCAACRRLIGHLSVLLRREPTMILCATGAREDAGITALLAALSTTRVTHLTLSPLTADDVHELLRHAEDTPPERQRLHARALQRRADGNPFVLTELLRLPPDERADAGAPTPSAVARNVQARLDGLPDQARALVTQAAACGEELDLDLLAVLLNLPREQLFRQVEVALHAELLVWRDPAPRPRERAGGGDVGGYRFHSVLRDAVLSLLTPLARQLLHASVASAMRGCPGHSPVAVAEQLVQAGPLPSREELVQASLRAAAHCAEAGREDEASAWHRRAEEVAEDLCPAPGPEARSVPHAYQDGALRSPWSGVHSARDSGCVPLRKLPPATVRPAEAGFTPQPSVERRAG